MARVERVREAISGAPSEEYLERKAAEGWRMVAVEWERDTSDTEATEWTQTPFGLRTPDGTAQLAEHPEEARALEVMLGLVIDDRNSLDQVARELNRRGLRTRLGDDWSPSAVFQMLPRLVDVAPRIYASNAWLDTRRELAC